MSRLKEIGGSDDHEFWRLVIDSHTKSGLSVNKFCEKEGISPSSFYNWRRKLDHQCKPSVTDCNISEVSNEPGFIPIGQVNSDPKDLCIAFPNGIQINASSNCNIRLLCETVHILCEQLC